jgi:ATP-dependent Clp protease ATP-binding subunit ClpC
MLTFNYNSSRARKARFALKFGKFFRFFLGLIAVALIILGILVVLTKNPLGYVAIGFAFPLFAPLFWYKNDLKRLDPSGETVDGLISGSVLGRLPKTFNVIDLAKIVSNVNSGLFLSARFMFGQNFLPMVAENSPDDINKVFDIANEIRLQTKLPVMSSGILALALIKNYPDYETMLARGKLSFNDLEEGVRWHDRIYYMFERYKDPIKTGGIARDWTFGYTPLLGRFGRDISSEISAHGGRTMSLDLPSRQKLVNDMVHLFSTNGRQNVAIIGPDGAGKTSVVHDFAEKLLDASGSIPKNLLFRQVFLLDSAAIIAAAPGRGQIENLLNMIFSEAYRAKNIIICLDNAHLFFEDGVGSVDISNVILPILDGGALRIILTLNEQKFLEISKRNPNLVNSINRLNIQPANEEETLAAMEDRASQIEFDRGVLYTFQALKTAYRLSERYVYDLGQPGRALKLMESAANYAENKLITDKSVERAIEETTGVKVGAASEDESEKNTLLNLENLIHERMIDQEPAVRAVSDALRRARAGVANKNRPIGTFLFLGPTGVGKTELAKALAAIYFNGEENLVRVDMNQLATLNNVADLTADGADNPTSLTAQVMKKPFSVVLLDEIEKAHPNVLTALLQVLDEGILRDARGREVNFRDTIIIATSNAGAEQIRQHVDAGEQVEDFRETIINDVISSGEFRPEFINRFDETVVFKPLSKDDLGEIVLLIIKSVNKTLEAQKITVEVSPSAITQMVNAGYDPKMGARPMRRVVQKVIENIVATKMLSGELQNGGSINISANEVDAELARGK